MADLAVDDAGNALRLDGGKWVPAPIAVNDKGEKMAFDGEGWKSIAPQKSFGEKVGGAAKEAYDALETGKQYLTTQGTKVLSGLAGGPSDLSALGKMGADYALSKLLGPSRRVMAPDPTNPGEGPAPLYQTGETLPGSADINRFIFGTLKVPEKNLADVPALTLNNPGGLNGKVNIGAMADEGVKGALAMTMGPGGFANIARNALPGAIGGATGETFRQATHGTPYEIPATIFGNLVGGGTTMLGQKTAEKATSMLAPYTQGGKERIAQDIIGGGATDPKKAASVLDTYAGDAVPGVNQTAAKVSADPGLLSLENYAYGTAGANQKLQGLTDANNAARTVHLNSLEGGDINNFVNRLKAIDSKLAADVDQALATLPAGASPSQAGLAVQQALTAKKEALSAARSKAVQPLYDEVAQWTAPVDARNARVAAADYVNTTKGELQGTAKNAGANLYTADGRPDNTAQGLVAARQDLAHKMSKPTTTDAEARILGGIQAQTDRALEDAVPAARQARDTYRALSVPLEPFSRDVSPSVYGAINSKRPMDPSVVPESFMRSGQPGAAGIRDLIDTQAPVIGPMKGYAAGLARGNPDGVENLLAKYGPALNEIDPTLAPGSLSGRMQGVASANTARETFGATPSGRIAAASNPDKEIGTLLASRDGPKQISTMVMQAAKDPEALKGLRQGILDDFKRTIESRAGTDIEGNQTLISSKAKAWLENKGEAAGAALTPEQRAGLKSLVESLDVQSRTAPKMAGSDTVRNAMSGTFMGKILNSGFANIPGVSTLMKTAQTKDDIVRIVADTLADPAAAKVMLMKYNAGNAKLAEPIFRRLAQSQPALLPQEAGQ